MGIGGISPGQLLLIFLIVVVLFGTKKLRTLGQDLGAALHGFKKGFKEGTPTLDTESSGADTINILDNLHNITPIQEHKKNHSEAP